MAPINIVRTEKIRDLNDTFRKTLSGGTVVLTASVAALPETVRAQAIMLMASFETFDDGNDPHAEHDFGAFDFCGRKWFWKIDYYDLTMRAGAEDPSDKHQTSRVLTLMLAEDY
jgi:hypothetical protein